MKYNRFHLTGALGCLALLPASLWAGNRPNVIYVFPDQYRNMAMGFWNDPSFKGYLPTQADPVQTPNINRFAKESLVLSSAMSNCPLSSPHRGSLLTGMYPNKSGVPLNCHSLRPISTLRTDLECISDVFSKNGYDCAYIGKLHAEWPTPTDPNHPGNYVESPDVQNLVWDTYTPKDRRHGFNYWYSYGTFDVHKNPHYWDNEGRKHEPHEWSPIHEAKKAIEYLKNEHGERDASRPFFMMISMNPPHAPYHSLNDCMEEDYNLYKDRPIRELLVRDNVDFTRKKVASAPYYFASVTGVDRTFGMILAALKDLNLDENTIVIFTSDHGETMCSQATDDPKNSPYAEAMNVPFIVRYPERIKPRVDNLLLSTPDIMPTLLGLCDMKSSIPENVQGNNYASLFFNPNSKQVKRPEGALYLQNLDGNKDQKGRVLSYFPKSRGIKTKDYTLALYIDKNRKLEKVLFFDDKRDPYQMKPLQLTDRPKAAKKLLRLMAKQLKTIQDPWYKERILEDLIKY